MLFYTFHPQQMTTIGNHATISSIGCTESNHTWDFFCVKSILYILHKNHRRWYPKESMRKTSLHGLFFWYSEDFFLFIFAFSNIVFLLSRIAKTSVCFVSWMFRQKSPISCACGGKCWWQSSPQTLALLVWPIIICAACENNNCIIARTIRDSKRMSCDCLWVIRINLSSSKPKIAISYCGCLAANCIQKRSKPKSRNFATWLVKIKIIATFLLL